eukprot:TRINITY_DN4803_c0_g4_i1.p1 TRINITY_DN4803_c0_g4~~TRINITY_DN4803_c0_g4_i1.p1  ORF type:complete len:216 (+),score=60.24 TRINITY_DN4803_c0_g4_i1:1537-2184(+)
MLEECEDSELVYMGKKIDAALRLLAVRKPSVAADRLMISVEVDLNMSCVGGFSYYEPKIQSAPLSSGDKPVSLEEYAIPPNYWLCTCGAITSEKELMCKGCGTFRLVESLANMLDNPSKVTREEINLLERRRELEKYIICARDLLTKDVIDMEDCWYLISTEWLNQWKAFVFNKPIKGSRVSSNPIIGVLPPGPITNHKLLLKDKKTLKENLQRV